MRPRQDRWFLLLDLAAFLQPTHPRLACMTRATKRKFVYRMVRTLERTTGRRYAKRVGRALYVSKLALEDLLPQKQLEAIDKLESNQNDIATELKRVRGQVNDHGSRLRVLERNQKLTTQYLSDISCPD